jgi:hypothetical protein
VGGGITTADPQVPKDLSPLTVGACLSVNTLSNLPVPVRSCSYHTGVFLSVLYVSSQDRSSVPVPQGGDAVPSA